MGTGPAGGQAACFFVGSDITLRFSGATLLAPTLATSYWYPEVGLVGSIPLNKRTIAFVGPGAGVLPL
jgi:hypothetical protein